MKIYFFPETLYKSNNLKLTRVVYTIRTVLKNGFHIYSYLFKPKY
jgi:hypothetical protein